MSSQSGLLLLFVGDANRHTDNDADDDEEDENNDGDASLGPVPAVCICRHRRRCIGCSRMRGELLIEQVCWGVRERIWPLGRSLRDHASFNDIDIITSLYTIPFSIYPIPPLKV